MNTHICTHTPPAFFCETRWCQLTVLRQKSKYGLELQFFIRKYFQNGTFKERNTYGFFFFMFFPKKAVLFPAALFSILRAILTMTNIKGY